MRFQKTLHGTEPPLIKRVMNNFAAGNFPQPTEIGRSAKTGAMIDSPLVVEMRKIQEEFYLKGKDMVLLYNEIVPESGSIDYNRYQMIVQGNLHNEKTLQEHLNVFQKIKKKLLKKGYDKICGKSTRQIIGGWVDTLGMDREKHSIYRELELVTHRAGAPINFSTLNRWANNDQQPSSYEKLLKIQKQVDAIGKKWKPSLKQPDSSQ